MQYNKLTHSCSGYSVLGVLGQVDQTVLANTTGQGRATTEEEGEQGVRVAHFSWDQVERETGLTINTIIFDCEGCMFPILSQYGHKFRQIDKVVIENDKTAGWECDQECEDANKWLEEQGMVMSNTFIGASMHKYFVFRREGK